MWDRGVGGGDCCALDWISGLVRLSWLAYLFGVLPICIRYIDMLFDCHIVVVVPSIRNQDSRRWGVQPYKSSHLSDTRSRNHHNHDVMG
jgi:hypothetical protein